MTLKKNGLNDSDKILVTVALWLSMATLFMTALTLPMLPPNVMIFYRTADGTMPESYSKYNNLFLILVTLIPTVIIFIAAGLKRHNRLQNNFMSVMLFSIMLALSIGAVIVYGIVQQFNASSAAVGANIHGIVAIIAAFVLSLVSAVYPSFNHRIKAIERAPKRTGLRARVAENNDRFWSVGGYGYLIVAIVCSFLPHAFAYIPVAVAIVAHVIFMCTFRSSTREERVAREAVRQ